MAKRRRTASRCGRNSRRACRPSKATGLQLQQVILNLIVNAIEAMSGMNEAPRNLLLTTEKAEPDGVLVAVRDSGPGLTPENLERLFDAFYTTKANGMGMGLSICRSIIEAHGGRLWASANDPRGAVFHSPCLPIQRIHHQLPLILPAAARPGSTARGSGLERLAQNAVYR